MTGEAPFRGAARAGLLRRLRRSALAQLTMTRILETLREPGTMFWVFGFPILLSVGLGLAFRNHTPEPPFVGVLDGEVATATAAGSVAARELEATLQAAHLHVDAAGAARGRRTLARGQDRAAGDSAHASARSGRSPTDSIRRARSRWRRVKPSIARCRPRPGGATRGRSRTTRSPSRARATSIF